MKPTRQDVHDFLSENLKDIGRYTIDTVNGKICFITCVVTLANLMEWLDPTQDTSCLDHINPFNIFLPSF